MPTYDYECTQCGKVFELFQSMKDKPKKAIATDCKKCKNKAPVVRRIGGGAGILFRGSGFYQTDYRSDNYKKSEKAESDSAKGTPAAESGKKSDGPAKSETKPADKPSS
ncbi:MAG: FmdB family zinc ribbon protein [Planctomycetota bacterium]